MSKPSFSDELWNGLGNAIDDIRAKFEESVYGRTVTEHGGEAPAWPQAQEPEPSFGSVTHSIDVGPTHDQMGDNANYRLAQMERECNSGHWPEADQSHTQRIHDEREQHRDVDIDR
jgi:hypothetical protein